MMRGQCSYQAPQVTDKNPSNKNECVTSFGVAGH